MGSASRFNTLFLGAINRLGQLILLNFCFLLCSIPLVTGGAALTALYTVCFRLGTPREGKVVSGFFRAFRDSWKQSTLLWLILLPLVLLTGWLSLYFLLTPGLWHNAFVPFLVLLLVLLMGTGYVFPLLALFENTTGQTLKNAFILGLGNLPRSVLVTAVNVLPLVLPVASPHLFARVGIFLLFFCSSACAWLNTWLLRPVFAPFLPAEEEAA